MERSRGRRSTAGNPPKRSLGAKLLSKCPIRRLNSNGAYLVLAWNLLVFSYQFPAFSSLLRLTPLLSESHEPWKLQFWYIILQEFLPRLFYPLAGWIADAKVGRYKVIKFSLITMWIGSLLLVFTLIFQLYFGSKLHAFILPAVVIYLLNAVGIAGFHANIIPFGIDQMECCSSEQCSAFIHWYYWSRNFNFGFFIQVFLQALTLYCDSSDASLTTRLQLYTITASSVFLTLAVCSEFIFSRNLLKDPKTHYPIDKIWKVTRFVARNKSLVGHRKAITYAYHTIPSRTDFAKTLYGGPYDVSEVEDVKTFWRIVVILVSLGGGVILTQMGPYTYAMFLDHMKPTVRGEACSNDVVISSLVNPLTFTFLIPLYEFLIYPCFGKYVPAMMRRIGVGMVMAVLLFCGLLVLDAVGHAHMEDGSPESCLFFSDAGRIPIIASVLIPFIVVLSVAEFLIMLPTLEFLVAQSPYEMRGLVIGLFYTMYGIFSAVVGFMMLAFAKGFGNREPAVLTCGSWFYLTTVFLGVVGVGVYFVGARWYRKRQRDGVMVNDQAVLEAYYSGPD